MDIGRPHVLHSRIFPLIISYIPIAFSFYVPRDKTVPGVRNKPHFVSLLSSLCFSPFPSRFITIAIAIHCLQGEGREIRFRGGACWGSALQMKKQYPWGNPWEGCGHQSIIWILQLLCPSPPRHRRPSKTASLTHLNGSCLIFVFFFCIAFPLRLFRDSYSQYRKT